MKKRNLLLGALTLAIAPLSMAQLPNGKPVRIVSSFSPGGPVDFVARTFSEQLGRELRRGRLKPVGIAASKHHPALLKADTDKWGALMSRNIKAD